MSQKKPEIISMDVEQIESLLERIEAKNLQEEDYDAILLLIRSYAQLTELLANKQTTLARLRKLLFGASTEKTKNVVDPTGERDSPGDSPNGASGGTAETDEASRSKAPGHGRNGADAYRGAEQIEVPLESLEAGDECPKCEQGTLYSMPSGVLVRLAGQAPIHARVYHLEKLRCNLCGEIFTANAPAEAGEKKYDETAAAMIALLKYGSGLPFNRIMRLEQNLGIPLPPATQWDVVRTYAAKVMPVYDELIRQAAQGDVLHNDDTTVKILDEMASHKQDENQRTGLFTSGVVATHEGIRIALFFSGHQHAGENLADVLKHRAEQLDAPIQMCDALSRNLCGDLETIVANCLAHARRYFVDVYDQFPEECRYVLEAIKVVYRNDAHARQRGMSPEKRLGYHRVKSQQTMARLHRWLKRQLDEKLVEPNSGLGQAITYMIKHWEKLTLFLRKAGAPLDNNIVERALKKSILHRKNSLFYKTANGAAVGDMFMGLIHTCELSDVNPLHYLTELMRHADETAVEPRRRMPWNYQQALTEASAGDSRSEMLISHGASSN